MENLLTLDDLAERWGVSKAYVYQLSASRRIPKLKLSRGVVRFREQDICAFETEHLREAREPITV